MSEATEPVRRQRLAAYVIVVDGPRILLTQLSDRTGWPGGWTLPGGGVDHGEDPRDTVVRETFEETGQEVGEVALVDVVSEHFEGISPRGVLEDFHAVRLLFTGVVASPTEPVVHDVGGTTSQARWVDRAEADGLHLVPMARAAVDRLLAVRAPAPGSTPDGAPAPASTPQ
jgi:8-oxo-dGTP pyrophosphatase MutT (NUDIX family)